MHAVIQFCDLAISAAAMLPAAERADIYDTAAFTLLSRAEQIKGPESAALIAAADSARIAARTLREAEAAQLTFKQLLRTTA